MFHSIDGGRSRIFGTTSQGPAADDLQLSGSRY
jgi:hypothetical protein